MTIDVGTPCNALHEMFMEVARRANGRHSIPEAKIDLVFRDRENFEAGRDLIVKAAKATLCLLERRTDHSHHLFINGIQFNLTYSDVPPERPTFPPTGV